MAFTSFPIDTTTLQASPTQSSVPAGTNLVVITPAGGVGQTPASLLVSSIFFNVKSYGAIGDGTTNDRLAIQNAINAASTAGGGTVYLPPGVYYCATSLTVPANVALVGDRATIKGAAYTDGAKIIVSGSNATLKGITIDGLYTSGSGSLDISFGLVEILNTGDSTALSGIIVEDCIFKNSKAIGVRFRGYIDGLRIRRNIFAHNFTSVWGAPYSTTTTFQNVFITENDFQPNWGSGSQSGAVKLQGDLTHSLAALNCVVDNNSINGTGEMGIELWKLFTYPAVRNNTIRNVNFCISIDKATAPTITGNKCSQFSYAGIEFAVQCYNGLIAANEVIGYTSTTGTTRGGTYGIILSNLTNYQNSIVGNLVAGVADTAIFVQTSDKTLVQGNNCIDSSVLINSQDSSRLSLRGNTLQGPCGYHVFLNQDSQNCTDIDIDSNTFTGNAANDNIIYYNAGTTNTLTNLRISGNNAIGATFSNLSINRSMAAALTPNAQCYGNYFKSGGSQADFSDFSTGVPAPYASSIQRAGITVASKTTITHAAAAPSTWYKVWSSTAYGVPILMQMHIATQGLLDNRGSAMTAVVVAAPYAQSSVVNSYPEGDYQGGLIDAVIYNNPGDAATQEIWVKLRPSTAGGKIDVYMSDYADGVIASPAAVTTEPSWASNSYIGQKEVYRRESHEVGLIARQFIGSGTRGNISQLRARLHIIGPGVASEIGSTAATRIARFEKQDGTEAFGVTDNGVVLVPLSMKVGAVGGTITSIQTATINYNWGTVNANSEAAVDISISCDSAAVSGVPTVEVGWSAPLPTGIVLAEAWVSAVNQVSVRVRNTTGSNIAMGSYITRVSVTVY